MRRKTLLDHAWAGHAFLSPPSSLSDTVNNRRRYYTNSSRKFTDSSLGGNFVVNPLPQFTGNCDFKHPSIFAKSKGTGRWLSEVLEDNSQIIHIRAGIPRFNSMSTFFTNFYNVHASSVVRTGRGPDIWFQLGKIAGFVGTIPFQPFILAGSVIKFFMGMPRTKYYYLKPTMYPYWFAVSSMLNGIAANLGILPHFQTEEQKRYFDPVMHTGQRDLDALKEIMPEVMTRGGDAFDVFRIANRAQRLANAYREALGREIDQLTNDLTREQRGEALVKILTEGVDQRLREVKDPGGSLDDYEKAYLAFEGNYDPKKQMDSERWPEDDQSAFERMGEAWDAERRMGADFVSFRVNHTGTQSESFSNQASESSLQSEINGISAKAREARFNVADGNVAGPIGLVVDIVKSLATGILDSVQLQGFMALAGNAFTDIQRVYQSSSADMNRTTFTIPLRTWAADDWVRITNIFYPLCAIVALGLPRATGPASYDGPFLLEVHNQGRTLIREGMIESISIERGVGDVGWARGSHVLGIDVNVTIVDLSSVMSVPINPAVGLFSSALSAISDTAAAMISKSTYSEDNKYTDWISTLASVPLEDHINVSRKWKLAMARTRAQMAQWRSPDKWFSQAFNTLPGELVKAISPPTDRI